MSKVRRHKIANKYYRGLDAFAGDDGSTASLVSSALAELSKTGGGMVAQYQASDAAKKKADADKKAYDAAHADEKKATDAAMNARKAASFAQIDAQEALDKANAVEQDPNGPMHAAAKDKAKLAALADVAAKSAEAKVAYYKPASTTPTDAGAKHGARSSMTSGTPWWMFALGGVAVVGGSFMAYKMMRGRK